MSLAPACLAASPRCEPLAAIATLRPRLRPADIGCTKWTAVGAQAPLGSRTGGTDIRRHSAVLIHISPFAKRSFHSRELTAVRNVRRRHR